MDNLDQYDSVSDSTNAVILLSGGLDSATTLAIAQSRGHRCYTLTFAYGQRHEIELKAAENIARQFHVVLHTIVNIDLKIFGGSALTSDINVPKGRSVEIMAKEIPVTYVPARNTIFLSYALAYAEVNDAHHIFFGANAVDYSGYPDCRPEYIHAFERMANLATKDGVEGKVMRIHAPLLTMSKAEIIREGVKLGVDYSITHSCYDPQHDGRACGRCDSCLLRKKGFADAGIDDPTYYVSGG